MLLRSDDVRFFLEVQSKEHLHHFFFSQLPAFSHLILASLRRRVEKGEENEGCHSQYLEHKCVMLGGSAIRIVTVIVDAIHGTTA